jgi:dipeptidyl aminopeptidase/acylaminoacyl peptidase
MRTILLLLCVAVASCKHAGPPAAPPAESALLAPKGVAAFSHHNRYVEAKISPKGTYLAAISTEGGKRWLSVIDLAQRKLATTFRPEPESVGEFYWANDSRVLIQLWNEGDGTLAAPVSYGEIYGINATGGRGQMIFGYRAQREGPVMATGSRTAYDNAWGKVVSRLRNDDRRVLIQTTDYGNTGETAASLYKMDVYSGLKTQVTMAPRPGASFITDENGEPRIAAAAGIDTKPQYFYRDVDSTWSELTNLKGISRSTHPMEFEARTRTLDVTEPMEKGMGLFALRLDTGERKLLSRNDWVPPSHLLEDHSQRVLAVQYEPDLPVYDFVVQDHPLSRALSGLLAVYPDENVRILDTTDDEKKAVVFVYSDRDPGRYLLLDVDKLSVEEIIGQRPWIKPEEMAAMTAFRIQASDGTWIHGYITKPRQAQPGPAPLVVLPHGGPHGVRDRWQYDSEVQLLASEGFAVLQVNFRGSGGYGLKYQEAGYRHWGDRMIEDIADATRFVVRKGYADPKRICIYGASFGAYAALQSTIVAPDLFRCAVGYAGVYDLTLMEKEGDIPETRNGRGFLHTVLGTDEGALKAKSPVYNADKIKAKVLLIHGKRDRRAPIEHAERMKDALETTGAKPEWLVESREGHGFYDEDARERMYTRLVTFLHENTN